MICPRIDCPVAHVCNAIEAWEEERIAAGVAKRKSEETHIMTCTLCGETRGWKRAKDGSLRALRREEIWGSQSAAS